MKEISYLKRLSENLKQNENEKKSVMKEIELHTSSFFGLLMRGYMRSLLESSATPKIEDKSSFE